MQQTQDIKAIRLFGWIMALLNFVRGSQSKATASKSYSIYTSINDLPFCDYKRLTVDKDLSALFIKEEDKQRFLIAPFYTETLQATADDITEQFSWKVSGGDVNEYVDLICEIESLHSKIQRIKKHLVLFIDTPNEKYLEIFKGEDLDYPTEDLHHYIQCIRNEIGSWEIKLQQKTALFEKRYKGDDVFTPTHEYYIEVLGQISDMKQREVADTITTLQFCVYYNELRKHVEMEKHRAELKEQQHGRSTR